MILLASELILFENYALVILAIFAENLLTLNKSLICAT